MAPDNDGSVRLASNLIGDLKGGILAAFISLPMSMSMGIVAFSPFGPDFAVQGGVAGIYGAIIVGIGTYLFGGRVLMVPGPRASGAVIFASLAVHILGSEDLMFPSGTSVSHVMTLGFLAICLAGVIQAGLGLLKLGDIVKFIPQPVIAGFINSSALLILLSQIGILLDIPSQETAWDIFLNLDKMRPLTMIPGIVAIAAVLVVGRWAKALPASFLGLVLGSATFYLMKMSLGGADVGTTMGELTQNLPVFQAPNFWVALDAGGDIGVVFALLIPAAISMAAVGSMETALSIAAVDQISEQRTDQNRELGAQGAANIAAALLGGLLATGGMVRTKPAHDMGGQSALSGVFCGLGLLAATLGFAELIEFIPRAAVAGVIVVLGVQIIDRESLKVLRRCCSRHIFSRTNNLMDAAVILMVILTALVFDLIVAVIVGILFALIIFVVRMSRSLIRRVGRGPAIHSRSAWDERNQEIIEENGHRIAVVELEGALFFATADTLDDLVRKLLDDKVSHLVLDMKRITQMDSSGAAVLVRLHRMISRADGKLMVSYILEERRHHRGKPRDKAREKPSQERRRKSMQRNLWRSLEETGVIATLGKGMLFKDTDSALVYCEWDIIDQVLQKRRLNNLPAHPSPAIIDGLRPDEIRFLRRQSSRCFFKVGETIFKEGEPGDALHLLTRGRADVSIYLSELGQYKRLQTLLSGAVFGEMALLDNKPRAASVHAVDETECYRLSIEGFELIKRSQPEMALKLLNNLCIMFSERMRSANTMISELEK